MVNGPTCARCEPYSPRRSRLTISQITHYGRGGQLVTSLTFHHGVQFRGSVKLRRKPDFSLAVVAGKRSVTDPALTASFAPFSVRYTGVHLGPRGRQPAVAKDIAITPRVTSTKVAVGVMRPSCLFRKAQMRFLSIFTEVVSYPSEL